MWLNALHTQRVMQNVVVMRMRLCHVHGLLLDAPAAACDHHHHMKAWPVLPMPHAKALLMWC
jgi:hypothetical protein